MSMRVGSGIRRGVRRYGAVTAGVMAVVAFGGVHLAATAATTTLYVSQGKADTGTCATASTPCGHVSYALTKAPSGATIKVSGTIDDHVVIFGQQVTITNWPGGPAGSSAALDGTGTGIVVTSDPGAVRVTLADLTIQNGATGVSNGPGVLTLSDITVSGNTNSAAAFAGIWNDGTMTISDSTIAHNTGNSTAGAGVYNLEGGHVTIVASTISANTGGGIESGTQGSVATLGATIVADQTAGSNCLGLTPSVSLQDDGYNLTNDATGTACNFTSAAHDLINKNPLLGALTSNGGPTKTLLPATTSPAANVIPTTVGSVEGVPVCPGTDQRGSTRPGTGHSDCSIGAVEVALTTTTTTKVTLLPATSVAHGTRVTYVVTVTPKTGNGVPTGTVTFKTGTTTLCKAVLSGGAAACGATTAPVGTDTIKATYSGGGGFATSSGTAILTVT